MMVRIVQPDRPCARPWPRVKKPSDGARKPATPRVPVRHRQPPARERGRSCVRMLRMTECKKRNRYTPIEIIKNTITD
ncbi:hypothetical protein [Burkholderia vietnamiensis]|uniref:hypothetical protein n=1 Tax=Burkholderia vietnamiensis TaxID=60552 RepID=UPI000A9B5982|nr:hypothetical protein [Burkholderia vietnamiensis]